MSDKYDEVANKIIMDYFQADNYNYDQEGVIALLKRVFPPPAEDARQLAELVLSEVEEGTPHNRHYRTRTTDEAAAEISRFAESRVEPWREAIKKIARDEVSPLGDVCPEDYDRLRSIARALLSDSPAKEAR